MWVATSVEEAARAVAAGALPLAGRTVLRPGALPPDKAFVDISRLDGLRGIDEVGDAIRIGALTDLETVREHPLVRAHLPALAGLLGGVASVAVRHLATIGGNLAWRQGDLVPVLLALGAVAETTLGDSEVDALGHGALVLAVRVPRQTGFWFAEKVGYRSAFSPPLVTVAAASSACREPRLRVSAGGGATRPCRLTATEALLARGERDPRAIAREARKEIEAVDDVFASAAHRRDVAARVLGWHLREAPP